MKKASAIIRESIEPRWGPAGVAAVERLAAHIEAIEQVDELERVDDDWVGLLAAEARAIVLGQSTALPGVEHLQALLAELDGARRALSAPPIDAVPF